MKLEKLTKEQEEIKSIIAKKWIDVFHNNTTFNEESVFTGIEWLYDFCGIKKPLVLICDNPMEVQLIANFFKKDNVMDNVMDNVRANVRDNVWDNVGDNVRDNVMDNVWDKVGANVWANVRDNVRNNVWDNVMDNVWDNVGDNVWDNVMDNVWDNVGANVRANVRDNVWDNVGANVRDNVRNNVWDNVRANVWDKVGANVGANVRDNVRANVGANLEYQSPSSYVNYSDSGWVAFYDFFTEIGVLSFKDFNKYKDLIKNGVYYSVMFQGVCIVSRPPSYVIQNNDNQLHNVNGKAIKFRGNYGFYSVRGVIVSFEVFTKLKNKKYTFEDFVNEKNEEVKNVVLSYFEEAYGAEYLFRFLSDNLKEIDSYTNMKDDKYLEGTTRGQNIGVYTLFKGSVNNVDLAFVRCYCPSTDRLFFLGVHPDNENAKDAIASLYRVPRKLVKDIKYIQRQGERFSTFFENPEKSKELTQDELSDLVSLTGEDYFNLITYEY